MVNPFIFGTEQAARTTEYALVIDINCFRLYAANEKKHENKPFLLMFCAGYGIRILERESSS